MDVLPEDLHKLPESKGDKLQQRFLAVAERAFLLAISLSLTDISPKSKNTDRGKEV